MRDKKNPFIEYIVGTVRRIWIKMYWDMEGCLNNDFFIYFRIFWRLMTLVITFNVRKYWPRSPQDGSILVWICISVYIVTFREITSSQFWKLELVRLASSFRKASSCTVLSNYFLVRIWLASCSMCSLLWEKCRIETYSKPTWNITFLSEICIQANPKKLFNLVANR